MWLLIIVGIILIGIGLGVHVFKWYFLISGYNTMSKEKKEKVDIKGLARLLGIYAYINGGLFILAGGLVWLRIKMAYILGYNIFCNFNNLYFN
ncbi:DUF3784 domain-containing protein [Herbinix luporum]|uniref:DUF3784 domain-containing protein n=1 Tax=Herbinix luporum TaxID=1679721 RepID=UPI000B3F8330